MNADLELAIMTVIYPAHRIITMNPSNPEATHGAVRDGRILGVGSLAVSYTHLTLPPLYSV